MLKRESLIMCAMLVILVGFPAGVYLYQGVYLPGTPDEEQVIDLVARAPEAGGWSQEVITVNVGDSVRLRITGHDVVHGFAIGRLGIDVGRIVPGEITTVEFVADKAGRFTFYCNVWCSPFHYRMRGTLEVVDPDAPDAPPIAEGESDFTHLDIDSAHEAEFYPLTRPSVERGRAIAHRTGQSAPDDLRGQSPSVVYQDIRREQAAASLSDEETWDLVAHYWSTTTTPERLATGRALYDKNCAACHGATGGGDGPGGRYLEKRPVDFTRAQGMAGGSSDIYYAKIRRGGMGTGMPYWGPVFSEEETWSIVDYLWTFLFDDAREEN